MAYTDDLATARDNMATAIKVTTARWTTAGCPATYSIDGQSVVWNDWLRAQLEGLEKLNQAIARASPYQGVSRGL